MNNKQLEEDIFFYNTSEDEKELKALVQAEIQDYRKGEKHEDCS